MEETDIKKKQREQTDKDKEPKQVAVKLGTPAVADVALIV